MLFDTVIRPAMYRIARNDAETVHQRTLAALTRFASMPTAMAVVRRYYGTSAPTTVFGLRFPNPVGLAAGMDKDGTALPAWSALGFGFVEVGTVTWHAQQGNPRPRLFHLPDSDAVLNRMGFNNAGAEALADRVATQPPTDGPLGISIGKSKTVGMADAVADYQASLRTLYPYADYFAINVSSPNTPGLRNLQDREALTELLGQLRAASRCLAQNTGHRMRPLLVKIAPDLSETALGELLDVCMAQHVDGVIATNSTFRRTGLADTDRRLGEESGGLSGRPLACRAREVVRFVHQHTGGQLPVIGVGGIFDVDDARRMLDAGASLIQLYTGFALHGPGLVRRINRRLGTR